MIGKLSLFHSMQVHSLQHGTLIGIISFEMLSESSDEFFHCLLFLVDGLDRLEYGVLPLGIKRWCPTANSLMECVSEYGTTLNAKSVPQGRDQQKCAQLQS